MAEKDNLPELSKGWVSVNFKVIIENLPLTRIKLKKGECKQEGKMPVIDQGQDFIGGYTDREELRISCRSPMIIFGDHTKIVKFVDFDFVAGADGIKVLKPIEPMNPKLIFYFTQAIPLPDKGYARHYQFLEKASIPLPPLPEQHRIVSKIEELFTKLDAGVEALKKIKAQLKRYRQSVLIAAMEGMLTEEWREANKDDIEPASVLIERILKERRTKWEEDQLANMKAKGKPPKDDSWKKKDKDPAKLDSSILPESPKGWEWVNLGEIHLDKSRSVSPQNNSDQMYELYSVPSFSIGKPEILLGKEVGSSKRTVEEAAVLLCKINPRINRVWVVGDFSSYPKIASTEWIPFFQLDGIDPNYLCYFMKNSNFRDFLASNVSGVGGSLMRIKASTFAQHPFPLPPLSEQHRIVEEIERRLSIDDEIEATIDAELKRSERLRQSILKRAFSGKLVPQDPNDEPAEKLLARIMEEKARMEAERKMKGRTKAKRKTKQRRRN